MLTNKINKPKETQELLIRKRVEEMITHNHNVLNNFPKVERHVLCAQLRTTMYDILQLVCIVNRRYHKKTTMHDLDAKKDFLVSLIRIAYDLRYLSDKQYEIWTRQISEIGRMIGGWIKWEKDST